MATIDDFGDTAEALNNPVLGGPAGWAAAVRDAILARLPLSGGTLTGQLNIGPHASDGASAIAQRASTTGHNLIYGYKNGILRYSLRLGDASGLFRLYQYDSAGANLKALLVDNANTDGLLNVYGPPVAANGIATKGYVDDRMRAGTITTAAFDNSIYVFRIPNPPAGKNLQAVTITIDGGTLYAQGGITAGCEISMPDGGNLVVRGNTGLPLANGAVIKFHYVGYFA